MIMVTHTTITYKRDQLLMKCVYMIMVSQQLISVVSNDCVTQYYLQQRSVVDEVCLYDHGLSHTYKRDQLLMKCVYMIMVSHTILLTSNIV